MHPCGAVDFAPAFVGQDCLQTVGQKSSASARCKDTGKFCDAFVDEAPGQARGEHQRLKEPGRAVGARRTQQVSHPRAHELLSSAVARLRPPVTHKGARVNRLMPEKIRCVELLVIAHEKPSP
eukprot:2411377-Prymnesium_polylepis.1